MLEKSSDYKNSIPWTGKLVDLSQFQLEPIIEQKLRDDQVKVLESACGAQYAATQFIAVCSATNSVVFTTNGTATVTATSNLSAANTRAIVDYMKKKLIPKYNGMDYMCVASVSAYSGMFADAGTGGWVDVKGLRPAEVIQ